MTEKFIEHFVAIYREMALLHFHSATFPARCEELRKLSIYTMATLSLVYALTPTEQKTFHERLDAVDAGLLASIMASIPDPAAAVN